MASSPSSTATQCKKPLQSVECHLYQHRPAAEPSLQAVFRVAVNAPFAWPSGLSGAGIGVALIDSGVSNASDLNTWASAPSRRVVYQQSFVPGNSSASDQYGHGTHVAGLIAGDGLDSTGQYTKTFKGIGRGTSIIDLRVLDANGAGTDSLVIAAINQAIALKSRYNRRRDQPLVGPRGLRELQTRSYLPGSQAGLEERNCRGCSRRQ